MSKIKRLSKKAVDAWIPLMAVLIICLATNASGQEKPTFTQADSITYQLYLDGNWKKLADEGNRAVEMGYDFYYMRMRLGIAAFMTGKYRLAATHFEKALNFYAGDKTALDYLSTCYEWGGMETEAAWLTHRYKNLLNEASPVSNILVFGGAGFSDNEEVLNTLDIDGESDIYGEVTGSGDMLYGGLGITFSPSRMFRWFAGYNYMTVDKRQRVVMDGADTLENHYTLAQNQFSGRFPVRIKQRWTLIPSVDLVTLKDQPVLVSWDTANLVYQFDSMEVKRTEYIAGLKLFRDAPYWSAGVALSNSGLNQQNQWQGSVVAGYYPKASLDYYFVTTISALTENEEINFHFKGTAGAKVIPRLWLQGSAHFGDLKNAHDETSIIIFNSVGQIRSRLSTSAIFLISKNIILQIEYSLINYKDKYLEYQDYESFKWNSFKYQNHHITGGIKWKL